MQYWTQRVLRALVGGCVVLTGSYALAHSGGLNARGGHTDRNSGAYHCHSASCTVDADIPSSELSDQGYNRDDWSHWLDSDGDCMNTRHEVLLAQSKGNVLLSSDGCRVLSGVCTGPYTGTRYQNPSELDIDHVIPLAWAHAHGGAVWSSAKKAAFANDPVNLLAVDDGLNQSKGARGPSDWLPTNPGYVCVYLFRWVRVLSAYPDLSLTDNESRQFSQDLSRC